MDNDGYWSMLGKFEYLDDKTTFFIMTFQWKKDPNKLYQVLF